MGGQLNDGNLAGEDTRLWSRGGFGGRQSWQVGTICQQWWRVNGWQAGSHAGMGWGWRRAGPAAEKMAHDDFFQFKSFFQLNKSAGENKNKRNTWGPQKMQNLAWR
jgi:hypothetical protein